MLSEKQKEKARIFSNMHKANKMFILPGAWGVGSAYVFEKQGFKAVATSSAGIAHDLGYPDGQNMSYNDLLWVVEKIARRIDIPLSVDIERGFSEINEEVKENVRKLLAAGAVGLNIEDGLPGWSVSYKNTSYMKPARPCDPGDEVSSVDIQVQKIKAIAELKSELGIDFVINARTDLHPLDATDEKGLKAAIDRCNAFAEAGADCIFVISARDDITISKLVAEINAPINIFLRADLSSFEKLDKIGVRRLSTGCNAPRFAYSKTIDMADNLYNGNVSELLGHGFSSGDANAYFEKGVATNKLMI